MKPVVRGDYRLGVWAVARNARALVTRPQRLFEAEPCHPAPRPVGLVDVFPTGERLRALGYGE